MSKKNVAHDINKKWRSDDIRIGEDANFSSLLLPTEILIGLKKAGFKYPSPIQLKAIPVGKIGKDLIVQAKSGTGKTLVFSIIALNMLLKGAKHPQVLIMAPTREIANQICEVVGSVGAAYKDFACGSFIGGQRIEDDVENIQGCQVIVGTPGRIKQLINSNILKTGAIRLFVLDEADTLLKESSFTTDINDIFRALPHDKQTIATSATYPDRLKKLTNKYFRDPIVIRLNKDEVGLLGMVHYYQVIPVIKMPVVAYKLKLKLLENVLLSVKFAQCLVFCNMVSRVENLCVAIKNWGFATSFISSAREQADRLKAIELLKRFKCKVLVSSDVSSRGIDAENVDFVINFDLPSYLDTYFHRVGRAGRYGSKCSSVTFLTSDEIDAYEQMQQDGRFISHPLPDPIPKDLIAMQPKMKPIVKTEELTSDEMESCSDSSYEDLNEFEVAKKEKTKGSIKDIDLIGHNELCSSYGNELTPEHLSNQSDKNVVDSEVAITQCTDSHGMQNQLLDINSNLRSSVKEENDDFSSTSKSMELESDSTYSPVSDELKQQEIDAEVYTGISPDIVTVVNKDKSKFHESTADESCENDKLLVSELTQNSAVSLVEDVKNCPSDHFSRDIREQQQNKDASSCLADTESICEKTLNNKAVNGKLFVVNDSQASKMFSNPISKELVSSVIGYVKVCENENKVSNDCFTFDSVKSSQTINVESNDNFSSASLKILRSNLNKYRYDVFKDFISDIPEGSVNEKDSSNLVSENGDLNQNGESNIQYSSPDTRHVLFSTPKTEVAVRSGTSSSQESSGSDKDKLIEHFNSVFASKQNFVPGSSSSSESSSDTSGNSKDAMYKLTEEFNKLGVKRSNDKGDNIIKNTDLSTSSSDSNSGSSIDSENATDELEKEFTKFVKGKRSDGGVSKDIKETKKILHKIIGTNKCFKGIKISATKVNEESSNDNSSDSDKVSTKNHYDLSRNSSSNSDASTSKRKEVATSKMCSKPFKYKEKTIKGPIGNKITNHGKHDKYSEKSTSSPNVEYQRKVHKSSKTLRTKTIEGPTGNKITYYGEPDDKHSKISINSSSNSDASTSKRKEVATSKKCSKPFKYKEKTVKGPTGNKITYYGEREKYSEESTSSPNIEYQRKVHKSSKTLRTKTVKGPTGNKITYYGENDKYSEESTSSPDVEYQRKVHKSAKTLRTKTIKGPAQNKITYYFSGASSSETENDSECSTESCSALCVEHQNMSNTNKKYKTPSKTEPSTYDYSYPEDISNTYMGNADETPSFDQSHSYYQLQPTSYASNVYYQPLSQQIQSHANHRQISGTQCSQMKSAGYASNQCYQPSFNVCHPSCQMNQTQSCNIHLSGLSAGRFQRNSNPPQSHAMSNYQLQSSYNYNQCVVPSQHLCHPRNETCQSSTCAFWYDIFYKQWQFLSQSQRF